MKKFKIILMSIFGGIDVVFTIITPLLLAVIWVNMIGLNNWMAYTFYGVAATSTLFRGFKIGFKKILENEE